jgi:hypothetical protein
MAVARGTVGLQKDEVIIQRSADAHTPNLCEGHPLYRDVGSNPTLPALRITTCNVWSWEVVQW